MWLVLRATATKCGIKLITTWVYVNTKVSGRAQMLRSTTLKPQANLDIMFRFITRSLKKVDAQKVGIDSAKEYCACEKTCFMWIFL